MSFHFLTATYKIYRKWNFSKKTCIIREFTLVFVINEKTLVKPLGFNYSTAVYTKYFNHFAIRSLSYMSQFRLTLTFFQWSQLKFIFFTLKTFSFSVKQILSKLSLSKVAVQLFITSCNIKACKVELIISLILNIYKFF